MPDEPDLTSELDEAEAIVMGEPDFVVRTKEALADPQPGDRFHEMYSFWTVVVAVGEWGVTVLEAGGPFNLVPGRVRNDETPHEREQRRKRGEPYQEWVPVEAWQLRAVQRHYVTLAEFRKVVGTDLLADRGLDVSAWPQQRATGVVIMPGQERSEGEEARGS